MNKQDWIDYLRKSANEHLKEAIEAKADWTRGYYQGWSSAKSIIADWIEDDRLPIKEEE